MSNFLSREDLLIVLGFSVLTDELDTEKGEIDLSTTPLSDSPSTANSLTLVENPDATLRSAMEMLCKQNKVSPRELTDIINPLQHALHPYKALCSGFTAMSKPQIAH